jgi:ATP-binding cassette subfamily F protein 3
LETVTTRTVAFTPHGIDIYEGGFKDYQEALERQQKAQAGGRERPSARPAAPKPAAKPAPKPEPKPAPKSAGEDRDARKAATRDIEKKKKRVAELEKQIADLEATLESFRAELKGSDGGHGNWERLHELALKDREYSELLERAMKEWVTLSEELSQLSSADTGARQ